MRVVLDTNVVLSAFLWQKNLKPLYQAIREKKITPCFTQLTWQELLRTLSYKKLEKQLAKINVPSEEIISLIANRAHFSFSNLKINQIKDDASDNFILACAISARADFIISGDKHLLKLKSFQDIPILTPRQFLNLAKLL